jgi:hypothetical protein
MTVLVDVNMLLDVLTRRRDWVSSLQVLHLLRHVPALDGWTSALTVPVLYFFRRRVFSEAQARADTQTAIRGLQLVPLTLTILDTAASSSLPDFKDNIQLASTQTIQAAYLITRNLKDFQPAPLPVLTPEAWLALDAVTTLYRTIEDKA